MDDRRQEKEEAKRRKAAANKKLVNRKLTNEVKEVEEWNMNRLLMAKSIDKNGGMNARRIPMSQVSLVTDPVEVIERLFTFKLSSTKLQSIWRIFLQKKFKITFWMFPPKICLIAFFLNVDFGGKIQTYWEYKQVQKVRKTQIEKHKSRKNSWKFVYILAK